MIKLNTIYNEDCFETMKRMKNESINLILTSPPYNMTKRKGGYADTGRYDVYNDWKTEEEYIDFTENLFNEFSRIVTMDGVVLYNFGYSIENPALPYKLVANIVENTDWRLVDTIKKKKKSGLPFPANRCRLSRTWEFIFVFAKQISMDDFYIDKGVASVSEKTGQKYYNVFYNFILYSGKDFVVYDPFMGTGTTAVGCLKSKKHINYIGSEISEKQVKYSQERIDKINNEKTSETVIV